MGEKPSFLNNQYNEKNEKEPSDMESIFGDNCNIQKTFSIRKDLDINNNEVELVHCDAFWTELIDPDSKEIVEGKVYLPKKQEDQKEVVVFCPGYRGDFAIQESEYAEALSQKGKTVIFLRHNGLNVEKEDLFNCVHCKERGEVVINNDRLKYLGDSSDFSFSFIKANDEVLTALKALSGNTDIERVDIVGHSWGARIAIESLKKLNFEDTPGARSIKDKIKSTTLLGAWLETRRDKTEVFRDYFVSDGENDYFKNMDGNKAMEEIFKMNENFDKIQGSDLPRNTKIIGIHSVGDGYVDMRGEIAPFFDRLEKNQKGYMTTKDLIGMTPKEIGGRSSETHDYATKEILGLINHILETTK